VSKDSQKPAIEGNGRGSVEQETEKIKPETKNTGNGANNSNPSAKVEKEGPCGLPAKCSIL
jgi:hypothetical protein